MVSEENHLNPWCFMNDPQWGTDEDRPRPLEDTEGRLKGTQWCQCGNCKQMSSLEESICCHEFRSMDGIREGLQCIIQHEGFQSRIHSRDFLIEILQASTRMTQQEFERIENRCLRWASYRKFTNLVYGFLGKGHRIPVPSCVVSKIRELYPDHEGNYTGFRWYSEYATGDLQTHHNF
ncbi:P2X purinoceptor 7-like [Bufo gargarizans]|uniref:P2X purinoceptor 7-like n=1 Tax=Bufo gargarizans TaxID=30331 RepID=UPI001CF51370|nr:P2X purinoceptor 7-like [Bufo gargarizans]